MPSVPIRGGRRSRTPAACAAHGFQDRCQTTPASPSLVPPEIYVAAERSIQLSDWAD